MFIIDAPSGPVVNYKFNGQLLSLLLISISYPISVFIYVTCLSQKLTTQTFPRQIYIHFPITETILTLMTSNLCSTIYYRTTSIVQVCKYQKKILICMDYFSYQKMTMSNSLLCKFLKNLGDFA